MSNGREILTTAAYRAIDYWAIITDAKRDAQGLIAQMTLSPVEEGEFEPVIITAGQARSAAKKVLELYPKTAGASYILRDDIDAEAADMIVQVAAFGEIVYG